MLAAASQLLVGDAGYASELYSFQCMRKGSLRIRQVFGVEIAEV